MKKNLIFPHGAFCLFAVAQIFIEVAIFPETYPVLKNSWLHAWLTTMFGWQTKVLGFGPARTFTLSMISYFQNCSILKFIFYSHDTWNLYAQIYFNSNTNVHIYLLPIWKINNVPGRSSYRKTWLLIHSLLKLWMPLFYRQPPIWSTAFYILSKPTHPPPYFWKYLFGNIVQMKYRTKTQKTHKRKLFLRNNITCLF